MSTFQVTLTRRGVDLDLWCTTDSMGDCEARAETRSFVLQALAGAAAAGAPLPKALAALKWKGRETDEAFHREHVGDFIARTRLLRHEGFFYASERDAFVEELQGAKDVSTQVQAKFPPQRFLLQVRLTDARWAEGVPDSFGTSARDVWTQDPEVNVPAFEGGVVSEGIGGPMVKFPQAWVSGLVASADGQRLFVWLRHAVETRNLGTDYGGVALKPGGAVVVLDAETFAVQSHLVLAPLLWRDGDDLDCLSRVIASPAGDEVVLLFRPGSAVRYALDTGKRLGAIEPGSRLFEQAVWATAGKDLALIDQQGKLVLSFDADGRWPREAKAVALDDERLAVVGDKVLVVWDRKQARESMRVDLVKPTEVALLPGGDVAVAAGPGGKEQLRVFHADGTERSSINAKHARKLRASPSGLLAAILVGTHLYDPETERLVQPRSESANDQAWLGDERLAIEGDDRVQRIDVAQALDTGSTRKVKASTPATRAAAAAAPPRPKPVLAALRKRADEAIEGVRARHGVLCFDRASGTFPKRLIKELPASALALEGCTTIEAGWVDKGVQRLFLGAIQPRHVLGAEPGQHLFTLQGEALAASRTLGLDGADPAKLKLTLDGKKLTGAAFLEAWRPFAFYAERWVALSADGLRAATGTRDMLTWKTDPRSLDQIVDDALTWLRDLA